MPAIAHITWCWICRIIPAEACLVCLHACCQECIDDACGCPQCGEEAGEYCYGCGCPCLDEDWEEVQGGENNLLP
jgi:hypothetical protein